jgi:hypothetical protein
VSTLPRSFLAYVRASAGVRRWLDRGDHLAGAFLSRALTSAEKSELGIRIYDASTYYRGVELRPWEQAWLARDLPPAPAHLLVGGCGAGRELVWLAAAGYALDAFEPAVHMTRQARQRLGDRARIQSFRYEDLSAAVLDGRDSPAATIATERYDAVLLGWGSLTHVLEEAERLRLLRTLHRLCPRGPILASFWCEQQTTIANGRAARLGIAAGRTVARLRNLCTDPPPHEVFAMHAGFGHNFTRDEIEALAATVGRAVIWDDDTEYPHATFITTNS